MNPTIDFCRTFEGCLLRRLSVFRPSVSGKSFLCRACIFSIISLLLIHPLIHCTTDVILPVMLPYVSLQLSSYKGFCTYFLLVKNARLKKKKKMKFFSIPKKDKGKVEQIIIWPDGDSKPGLFQPTSPILPLAHGV
jgi:hypothetical protein